MKVRIGYLRIWCILNVLNNENSTNDIGQLSFWCAKNEITHSPLDYVKRLIVHLCESRNQLWLSSSNNLPKVYLFGVVTFYARFEYIVYCNSFIMHERFTCYNHSWKWREEACALQYSYLLCNQYSINNRVPVFVEPAFFVAESLT